MFEKKAISRRVSGCHPGMAGIFGDACGGACSGTLNNRIAYTVSSTCPRYVTPVMPLEFFIPHVFDR
jgi:hypothetical protein